MAEPTAASTWQPREHDRLCTAFESCGYCDAPGDYTETRRLVTPQGVIEVPMRPVCSFGGCGCQCDFIAQVRADERNKIFTSLDKLADLGHTDDCRDLTCGGCVNV